jgi:hypothetical protein
MSAEKAETINFPKFAARERLYQPGHVRQHHDYIAPAGLTADESLKPEYWRQLASQLRTYDTITVIEEACAWFAELLVLSSGATGVQVAPLRGINLEGRVGVNDAFERNRTGASVRYRGPHLRWCVMDAEGKPLQEKCQTEVDAYAWLNAYVKTVQK